MTGWTTTTPAKRRRQIPVLLGQGRRLFDHLGPDYIELKLSRIVDACGATHLRCRVRR
jgi:hypothetical protein